MLAFDPIGLGESDKEELPESIGEMADDAAGLASALGWDRYNLFGASMGGMVAQELVLRHPAVVRKLVLGVTHAGGRSAPPQVVDKFDELSTMEMLWLSDTRHDKAWADANPELVASAEKQFLAAKEERNASPSIIRAFKKQAAAVLKHDTYDRLPEITSPTLVFAGRYDGGCPWEITKAMAERISSAQFELVDYGHGDWFLFEEYPLSNGHNHGCSKR